MFSVKYPSVKRKNKGLFPGGLLNFVFALSSAVFLASCDGNDHDQRRADHEYVPLRKGWFQVYDVEETRYELGNPQTEKYALKTVVVDSFLNTEGNYSYIIHLSKKPLGTDTWVAHGTISTRVNKNEVVVSEENTPYVVLAFPAIPGTTWNGNAYNDEINPNTNTGNDVYEVENAGAQTIDGVEFQDCVSVLQEDNGETIVFRDQRREIYARHVGLVLKETTRLWYCTDEDRNCVGQEIIDEGIIYKRQIVSYGVE